MLRRALAASATTAVVLSLLIATPAVSAATTTAADLVGLLRTAPADTTHEYDRAAFDHWVDADADGCNTRYEVLIAESTTPVIVGAGCSLAGGTWVSPYDGYATTDPSEIQIDHVVALAEAWRSGAWAWTDDQRRAFANDVDVAYALTAASGTSNQAKSDKDPGRWLPTNAAYTCEYVISWALVKHRWSLTVDQEEFAALQSALSGECGKTPVELPEVQVPSAGPVVPSEPMPAPGGQVTPFPAGSTRLAGVSRYETAIAVSRRYSPGVPALFVATGADFPDALSAAAAAARLGGPLLLTPPTSLAPAVRDEIRRLRPAKIYIAGAHGAVDGRVETTLRSIAPVRRLGGPSRYDTGAAIVKAIFPSARHAFIATGRTFPDALAASGAAGATAAPVVLVDGAQKSLPLSTEALLSNLGVRSVTIVGGTGAVSTRIETQLKRKYATSRIGGASRYETAANINNRYFAPGAAPAAFVATGLNFPDALAGAALAGRLKSPVYVTTTACVPDAAHVSLLTRKAPATVALGSANVVSAGAAKNLGCLTPAVPRISGSASVASTLKAVPGAWTSGTSYRYQWLANGSPIRGATSATLRLTASQAGKRISVRVTGSKAGYTQAHATSGKTAPVGYPSRITPVDSWSCPSWAPIKGNASSMIYHVPGGAFYTRTNPEECFRTEAAAKAAGYRRSQR
ncbi:cell wall-binding repeat-containing protein [Microbacterium sp. NPDC058345]|uniref:cell wall-binding repeat-containing protein n=1 Tax=Microbacterium sp. NPDC058345 TaxID=3346455 RepID=UPI003664868C